MGITVDQQPAVMHIQKNKKLETCSPSPTAAAAARHRCGPTSHRPPAAAARWIRPAGHHPLPDLDRQIRERETHQQSDHHRTSHASPCARCRISTLPPCPTPLPTSRRRAVPRAARHWPLPRLAPTPLLTAPCPMRRPTAAPHCCQ